MAAPSGGGGGGGPLGFSNSFVGPQEALEIAGDFAYAYSGVVFDNSSSAASTTALSFTTGNYLFLGQLDMLTDILTNSQRYVDIQLNGTTIFKGGWDASDDPGLDLNPLMQIIIPAYTEVVVKWGASTDQNATFSLTGRIYR